MRTVILAVAGVLATSSAAVADDAIVAGAVVKVEQQEIYVSLGTSQRVAPGAALRLKRAIKLKHPITRATVEDWIPVGSATITQAGGGAVARRRRRAGDGDPGR